MLNQIIHRIKWNACAFHFDSAPKSWIEEFNRHCSVACQIWQELHGVEGGLVYTIKKNRLGDDMGAYGHFMNVRTDGSFTDLYHRDCEGAEVGGEIDFGDGPYVVVAKVSKMSEFGFTDILHMIKETRELNEWFEATR